MSRHSRGDESAAPRRSRRRVEEPSITEWLDSGSYGPYAADANRGLSEEPVSSELPPPYEPPAPSYGTAPADPAPSYDTGSTYGAGSYGAGSYGAGSYGHESASSGGAPSTYDTGSYGASVYGSTSADSSSAYSGYYSSTPVDQTSSYSGYSAAPVEPAPSYGVADHASGPPVESPSTYDVGSYGTSSQSGDYGAGSVDQGPSYDADQYGGPSPSSYSGHYGAGPGGQPPAYDAGQYSGYYGAGSVDQAPSYDAGQYGGYYGAGSADQAPAYDAGQYGGYYGAGSADQAPAYDAGQYSGYYGAGSVDQAPSYDAGQYSGYHGSAGTDSPYGGQSTEDSYGSHASYDPGPAQPSTPDSRSGFLAPPAYARPAERYPSIPAVSDPNRPPPGEYGLRSAEPPMADYLTRQQIQDPPMPVRRPTAPIPSAARSRKAPKEPPPPPVNRAGRLRLRVNPIACDGHGLCAELLPEVVSLDDWGYPMPVVAEIPTELEGHAQRAAQQCPTLAIILERRQPRTR